MASIDLIFAELKAQEQAALKSRYKKTKGATPPAASESTNATIAIDNPSSSTHTAVSQLKTSILAWSEATSMTAHANALGDSDDEEEVGDIYSTHRLTSALASSNIESRLDGLTAMQLAIEELLSTCDTVQHAPPLDLPPPYDPSRITLTHREQGALVSDLSSDRWSQWDRTQAPLLSQFQISTANNDDDDARSRVDAISIPITNTHLRLQALLNGYGCAIFRRFSDKKEKCRALALQCISSVALVNDIDMGKIVGLLMPAIFARFPPVSFDAEMGVFVHNAADHELHLRGGAIARQDRDDSRIVEVVEPSEEIRLQLCGLLSSLIRGALASGALTTLDPYLSDIILALYTMVRDPCPNIKVHASRLLVQLVRIPHWEVGAKYFALALARAAIPGLRHRNAMVRLAAIELFEASVCVPNRAKVRGAGSDAIMDMIGFQEDNVIPIAAYYSAKCSTKVNVLAELAIDSNTKVRLRCCDMVASLMTCLPDRYDHQTRLLPYLLNFFLDPIASIRHRAMDAIDSLGAQYEAEHPEEVIERRQYGIDGDPRSDLIDTAALPDPFETRPALGSRLFVRSNTRRFLTALLVELSSWRSSAREKAADLFHILIVYNEEHLIGYLNQILPLLVKALGDRSSEKLVRTLESSLCLLGSYIGEDVYSPLLSGESSAHALACMKGSSVRSM